MQPVYKLLLIGDSGVGKSSLLLRFADGTYEPTFFSTIGVDFRTQTLQLGGEVVRLSLWDTAGQERFRTITSSYYRGAHGIMLTYDVSDRASFAHLQTWYDDAQRYADGALMAVIGCKSDLVHTVAKEEGERWAQEHNALFCEYSAKDDVRAEDAALLFLKLADAIHRKHRPLLPAPQLSPPVRKRCRCNLL